MRKPKLMMQFWCATASQVAVVFSFVPINAAAQARSALVWQRHEGAESCISEDELRVAVEARLGRELQQDRERAQVVISGEIEPTDNGFQIVATYLDADGVEVGTRRLHRRGTECRALDAEIVLVFVLLIDPTAAVFGGNDLKRDDQPDETQSHPPDDTASPKKPSSSSQPSDKTVAETTVAETSRRLARYSAPVRGLVGVGVDTAAGLLPQFSVGMTVLGAVEYKKLSIGLELSGFPGSSSQHVGGISAEFDAFYGGFTAGFVFYQVSALVAVVSGGLQAGVLRVRGSGFDLDKSADRVMVQGVLRGQLRWQFYSHFALWLRLGLVVPFIRDRFRYRTASGDSETIYQQEPVAALLSGGLAVHW